MYLQIHHVEMNEDEAREAMHLSYEAGPGWRGTAIEYGSTQDLLEWITGRHEWVEFGRDQDQNNSALVDLEGVTVKPDYFKAFATDHLMIIWDWSEDAELVTFGETSITVPKFLHVAVGLEDGMWVIFDTWTPHSADPRIQEYRVVQGHYRDVSKAGKFPLNRWMKEAFRLANQLQLATGPSPLGFGREKRTSRRSDSPTDAVLRQVRHMREKRNMSFEEIGREIGKSGVTASRYYKRATGAS